METKLEEKKKPESVKEKVKVQVIWDKGGFVQKGEKGKTRPTVESDSRGILVGDVFHKVGTTFETTKVKADRWAAKGLVRIVG